MVQRTPPLSSTSPERGLLSKWISVLRDPGGFFGSLREPDRLGPPFLFAYVMVLIAGVLNVALSDPALAAATSRKLPPYWAFVAIKMAELPLLAGFLGGLTVWGLSRNLGSPNATYKSAVAITCYSLAILPVATVVGILLGRLSPVLGGGQLVFFYGFYIVARGLIVRHKTRPRSTYIVFALLALLVQATSYYALQRAAEQPRPAPGPSAPAGPVRP